MVENELDHQGDFGKMGARNGHPPEDGRAVISVSEDQDDPLVEDTIYTSLQLRKLRFEMLRSLSKVTRLV